MIVKITDSGGIQIPPDFFAEDGLAAGQDVEIVKVGPGVFQVKAIPEQKVGLYEWLRSCPVDDFEIVRDRSEMTDSLVPPSFK